MSGPAEFRESDPEPTIDDEGTPDEGTGDEGAGEEPQPIPRAEVFPRGDGRWGWRLVDGSGAIVAADVGAGFENARDAETMCRRVISGRYAAGIIPRRVRVWDLDGG